MFVVGRDSSSPCDPWARPSQLGIDIRTEAKEHCEYALFRTLIHTHTVLCCFSTSIGSVGRAALITAFCCRRLGNLLSAGQRRSGRMFSAGEHPRGVVAAALFRATSSQPGYLRRGLWLRCMVHLDSLWRAGSQFSYLNLARKILDDTGIN
jgi:hypothetical protein